jgi:hypothetical protein
MLELEKSQVLHDRHLVKFSVTIVRRAVTYRQ